MREIRHTEVLNEISKIMNIRYVPNGEAIEPLSIQGEIPGDIYEYLVPFHANFFQPNMINPHFTAE